MWQLPIPIGNHFYKILIESLGSCLYYCIHQYGKRSVSCLNGKITNKLQIRGCPLKTLLQKGRREGVNKKLTFTKMENGGVKEKLTVSC